MRTWHFWRPIMERMSTYEEMSQLDIDEVMMFNAAIDRYITLKNQQTNGGGGR